MAIEKFFSSDSEDHVGGNLTAFVNTLNFAYIEIKDDEQQSLSFTVMNEETLEGFIEHLQGLLVEMKSIHTTNRD